MDQAINYYTSVGRNWERLAFHRSSFLCGDIQKYFLFKEAIKVRERAYVPYSKFKVGVAFLTEDNSVDMVLTFRNLHNWIGPQMDKIFKNSYKISTCSIICYR